jgi:hypothetical protein
MKRVKSVVLSSGSILPAPPQSSPSTTCSKLRKAPLSGLDGRTGNIREAGIGQDCVHHPRDSFAGRRPAKGCFRGNSPTTTAAQGRLRRLLKKGAEVYCGHVLFRSCRQPLGDHPARRYSHYSRLEPKFRQNQRNSTFQLWAYNFSVSRKGVR